MGYFLDLHETAQYYDAVMQVAARSFEQIGNPVCRLRYEDLVQFPHEQLEKLLEFLRLEWDDAVLDLPQSNPGGASDTPSYQQVSEPLYTRSIGRWRCYSDQLEACVPVLKGWVRRFGYDLGPLQSTQA